MGTAAGIRLAAAAIAIAGAAAGASALPPKGHPVYRNIFTICSGQERCIERQEQAMKRALAHVRSKRPPMWKIEQCNRNAARRKNRVDWIGFNNCIRNPRLEPVRAAAKRR